MLFTQRQLAASLRASAHIVDREAIVGFLLDPATQLMINPFRQTSAGAQRSIWTAQSLEFRSSRTQVLGLTCLLRALDTLPGSEELVQELFGSGPCRLYIYHGGDACRVVGAVLHGRGFQALPSIASPVPRRTSRRSVPDRAMQLDLFALGQP